MGQLLNKKKKKLNSCKNKFWIKQLNTKTELLFNLEGVKVTSHYPEPNTDKLL